MICFWGNAQYPCLEIYLQLFVRKFQLSINYSMIRRLFNDPSTVLIWSLLCTVDVDVQDLCQLLNAEQPYWLVGMTEMTRTLCLELMEEVLSNYYSVFLQVCLLELYGSF